MARQALMGLGRYRVEVSRSRPVGLLGASDRPVAETTRHSQETDIHAPGGIRTRSLSKRAAADVCLRSRGHRYRLLIKYFRQIRFLCSYTFYYTRHVSNQWFIIKGFVLNDGFGSSR